jgi:hypothetical protein
VTRDQFTAGGAFPSPFLAFDELLEPVFLDEIQVFYHAHFVTGFVPLVQGA